MSIAKFAPRLPTPVGDLDDLNVAVALDPSLDCSGFSKGKLASRGDAKTPP
jgi:hypothetical protein